MVYDLLDENFCVFPTKTSNFLTLPHSLTPPPSPTLNTSRNSMNVLYYMTCKYCRPGVRPSLTSRSLLFLTTSKYIAKNYI